MAACRVVGLSLVGLLLWARPGAWQAAARQSLRHLAHGAKCPWSRGTLSGLNIAINWAVSLCLIQNVTYFSPRRTHTTALTPPRAGKHVPLSKDSRERPALETPYQGTHERRRRLARVVVDQERVVPRVQDYGQGGVEPFPAVGREQGLEGGSQR